MKGRKVLSEAASLCSVVDPECNSLYTHRMRDRKPSAVGNHRSTVKRTLKLERLGITLIATSAHATHTNTQMKAIGTCQVRHRLNKGCDAHFEIPLM